MRASPATVVPAPGAGTYCHGALGGETLPPRKRRAPSRREFFLDRERRIGYFVYERSDVMPYEDCIVYLLAKAYQYAHAQAKRHLAAFGLTPIQQLVLAAVCQEEGVSAGELGKKIGLDPATLSGVLDRMSDRGWVDKQTDAEDKRLLRIFLTSQAKENESQLMDARDKANNEILKNLSREEKVLLKRLLKDLKD
jgi:DNA-binding MarR family transcriptional regulator